MVDQMEIRTYAPDDCGSVIELWKECGLVMPWNSPKKDIERKIHMQDDLFLVAVVNQKIVGTIMGGYEGHRGWINYLAVLPAMQRQGVGRILVDMVQEMLLERGCPKVNLQVRSSNSDVIQFYRSLGFAVDDVVSLGKRLIKDEYET